MNEGKGLPAPMLEVFQYQQHTVIQPIYKHPVMILHVHNFNPVQILKMYRPKINTVTWYST
jgi:hypothetical protein